MTSHGDAGASGPPLASGSSSVVRGMCPLQLDGRLGPTLTGLHGRDNHPAANGRLWAVNGTVVSERRGRLGSRVRGSPFAAFSNGSLQSRSASDIRAPRWVASRSASLPDKESHM